jgi:hypothetical protein
VRIVRNILDQVIMNQNLRTEDDKDEYLIIRDDVDECITGEGIDFNATVPKRRIGFSVE